MDEEHAEPLEYESPRTWEEAEVEPGAVLSLVALLAMVALPAAVVVYLVFLA